MRIQRNDRTLQNKISCFCAIVFAIYSFTFIGVYQTTLLEALYDIVATGKLQYNGYVVAGIATTILVFMALWLNRFAKYYFEWTALAYLPSSLLLAFITDVDSSIYTGEPHMFSWIIILPAGFAVYALFAFFIRDLSHSVTKHKLEGVGKVIWCNMLLFTIMFCLTGFLSNSEENFKSEVKAYSYYKKGDITEALNVAKKSLNASHELTAARAFYLVKENKLSEHLFDYPQYYGAEGLLPPTEQTTPLHPDTIYSRLGAKRDSQETALDYLERVIKNDTLPSRMLVDYYLCALLLDKKVVAFVEELPKYYDLKSNEPLPKHYKEALLYYVTSVDSMDLSFDTDTMRTEFLLLAVLAWDYNGELPQHYKDVFRDYIVTSEEFGTLVDIDSLGREYVAMLKLEQKYPELHIRSNYIRKKYGNTYWWYFGYSE